MPATDASAATWLVVPTYNEAESIAALVAAARGHLPPDHRILIVDDGSPDGTGRIAEGLAGSDGRVAVLHRAAKDGLGPAYVAGFRRALAGGAERVVQMDGDLSHDPADLGRLLAGLERADVVIGSRYVQGGAIERWSRGRRLVSRMGSRYAQGVLGVGVRDLTGGFKAFRAGVLEAVDLGSIASRGYAFQIEMTYRALRLGFRVAELPVVFRERGSGESKMTPGVALEAAWRVPAMRLARFGGGG